MFACDFIDLTISPSQESDSIKINRLCYNAANMQFELRFANTNNNDNDDPRIVGRSLAG
jgi:hypothetical protein